MVVTFRYLPLPDRCKAPSHKRKGMSEREIRRLLEKRGWKVWRGSLISILRRDELYPNVKRKYELLRELLNLHHPGTFELLEYLCAVHHGIPDFLAFHSQQGFRFVECKLGHEQLSARQKACITKLQELGFEVEVWKLVEECTKLRHAEVDLESGEKRVVERQLKFTRKSMKLTT